MSNTGIDRDPADEAALAQLYRDRRDPSIRLAVMLVGDMAVAEEIVHDAFVEIARRWDQLDNPAGYLRTTVVNRCSSHRRRLAVIRRRTLPPLERHVDAPELDELWAVLSRLPARRRAAVVLRYYEDLPVTEIARLLGCPRGTVSSLLHRGLADLRKVLTDGS
jgi:RNA polymerase sigma factor (sigma-70 family)